MNAGTGNSGSARVAGVDEIGRAAWAGPVLAVIPGLIMWGILISTFVHVLENAP